MKIFRFIVLFILTISFACHFSNNKTHKSSIEKYWSTLDSSGFSVYLGTTIEKQKIFTNKIIADIETDEVYSDLRVDAADDPAIWFNREKPDESLILGTNKMGGIHVYDMNGKELQYIQAGCINNIDLRDDFEYKGKNVVIVTASNCSNNSFSLFYIDKETKLLSDMILDIKSSVNLVYGICMYKSEITGKFYVIINSEDSEVEQWELINENDELNAKLVRQFKVSSRPEGMVADDKEGLLYIGVEEEGILKIKAEPEFDFQTIWVNQSHPVDPYISSDIEGIALYKANAKTYLIASSQGNFSFAIFEIGEPDKYLTSFIIEDNHIDGVEETDGIDIISLPINENFPKGMLVVQDGFNFINDTIQRQNFKYISMERIEKLL